MRINGKEITFGADPEIFVGENGVFKNAHGLVPGSKSEPHPVDAGAIQVDGMALEFNINPASNYPEFQKNLDTVTGLLKGLIDDKEFLEVSSVHFDQEFLETAPFASLVMGCEPDYNAYTMDTNMPPNMEDLMRTAGGHVHVGGIFEDDMDEDERFDMSARLSRLIDQYCGVYSVLWDDDDDRRHMYGAAGSFRVKPYGMEYRTLSNRWLFNKSITSFVFYAIQSAVYALFAGKDSDSELYREIIDTSDRGNSFFNNNPTSDLVIRYMGDK